jgi:hypothetical protein
MLARYVQNGGLAFVDSGAFSAYNAKVPMTEEDFEHCLDKYERLLALSLDSPAIHNNPDMARDIARRWHMVAPDVIGDQEASVKMLARFAPRVRALIDKGVTVFVPFQRGRERLAACYHKAVKALRTDNFTSSIPSRMAPVPLDEVLEFAKDVQPQAMHLLGLGTEVETEPRRKAIQALSPHTLLTSDSARVRSLAGEGRPFTETVRREVSHVMAMLGREAKKRRISWDPAERQKQVGPPIRARVLAGFEGWQPSAA